MAERYVIAYEVGHHIQNELGVMAEVMRKEEASPREANQLSINSELQADCFAGLWAHFVKDRGVFEVGEVSSALDAAASVGDDRIQKTVEGRVRPETWTHGSAQQRALWFAKGYESGAVESCDTF